MWDIPVQKQKMTKKNYLLPVAYPSIYKTRTHKAQHTTFLKYTTKPKNTMHSSNEYKNNHIDYIIIILWITPSINNINKIPNNTKILAYIRTILIFL